MLLIREMHPQDNFFSKPLINLSFFSPSSSFRTAFFPFDTIKVIRGPGLKGPEAPRIKIKH